MLRARRLLTTIFLATGLPCLAQPAPAAPAPASAPAAVDQAAALARKIEQLRRPPAGKPGAARSLELSEGELAAYLNTTLRAQVRELQDISVRLERDRLTGSALVDFEQLRGKLPPLGPFNPLALLSGRVPSEFSGRLQSADGFATFELESLQLGPITVPLALVEQAVASGTKSAERPEGVDIHAPFRLPYQVRRVRLLPGRAVVEY